MKFKASQLLPVLIAVSVAVVFTAGNAVALSDGHATCNYCHDLHGGPGNNLLNQPNQSDHVLLVEVVCSNCHDAVDPPIATAPQVSTHNPNNRVYGDWDYISCRECHDPHDNQVNADGGSNLKMVGFRLDPANLPSGSSTAQIRLISNGGGNGPIDNQDHSDPAFLTDVIFADREQPDTDFHRSDGRGICAICHPVRNLNGHTQTFLNTNNCTRCHAHGAGFNPP